VLIGRCNFWIGTDNKELEVIVLTWAGEKMKGESKIRNEGLGIKTRFLDLIQDCGKVKRKGGVRGEQEVT